MAGLSGFILAYLALLGCFGWISYTGIQHFINARVDLMQILVTICAVLLTLFMTKSLFAIRRAGTPDGIEITAAAQPELFQFINKLADDIGAPRPHRVFLTPDVNAAVFYDLTLLNLFFPSKKN
jgi:putative intracellular protease/amidase